MKEIKLNDIKFIEDLDGKSIILNDNGLFKQSKSEDLKLYIFNKDNYLTKEDIENKINELTSNFGIIQKKLEEKILLLENKINELNTKLEDSKKESQSEIDGDKNKITVEGEQTK